MIGRETEIKKFRNRAMLANIGVLFVFGLVGARLFFLQMVAGEQLRRYSEANRLKKEKLFAPRGILYDRSQKVIVDNRASFDVVLVRQYYSFKEKTNRRLAKVLGMPLKELQARLKKAKQNPVFYPTLVKADVSKDVIAGIEMDPDGFPGVNIEANVVRRFPYGEAAAQVIGYVREVTKSDIEKSKKRKLKAGDYIGRRGLERRYDRELRGNDGVGYVEVDARGRRHSPEKGAEVLGFVAQKEPVPGNNLHLTLDMDLQLAAQYAMQEREYQGAVVAMDPRSGKVLTMANVPSYHPAGISGRQVSSRLWSAVSQSPDRPLTNRTIQEHYPPGSTFKFIVAAAALAEGVTDTKMTVDCKGGIRFGRRFVRCWKQHGVVDFFRSLKESCDVYYYKVGQLLGVDTIAKYARLFGLGRPTGIALANEVPGIIPDKKWKLKHRNEPWQPGETLSVAIGQGYATVSPLQLAVAFSALANGGFVYRPYIVEKLESRLGETIQQYYPELVRKIETPIEILDAVKKGLWQVVNESKGTAYAYRSRLVEYVGKTGTSQVRRLGKTPKPCDKLERKEKHHGLFAGFAPPKDPEIVVVAVGEHICSGSRAAPIVRSVMETYFKKKRGEAISFAGQPGRARTVAGEKRL